MSSADLFRVSLRRNMLVSGILILLLAICVGAASLVEISAAVIAGGRVSVSSEVKKVQHSTGGVVGEILVKTGQLVEAGQVVARLDATATRANMQIVSKSLDDLLARRARLVTERDGLTTIAFDTPFPGRAEEILVNRLMIAEQGVLDLRRDAREGEKAQLRERITQLKEQISGLRTQSSAKADELDLVEKDLGGVRKLWDQKLVQYARLNTAEREATKLKGEVGSIVASIAETTGRIAETELQILQVEQNFRSDVAKEMSEVDASIAELTERKVAAQDQLSRVDIRAPQAGMIHELAIHTVGGVVGPQETLMLIVPQSDPLVVDARVSPSDVDQIFPGQRAFLKFPAFSQKTTPESEGVLERISPDLVTDAKTGAQYYEVRIRLEGVAREFALVPGMPVEAFLQTGSRSILSYLVKPMSDFFSLALRAE